MKPAIYTQLEAQKIPLTLAVERTIKVARDEKRFIAAVPYTPVDLIAEICGHIPTVKDKVYTATIGVFFTVEAAAFLIYNGFTDVTVITDARDELVAANAARWGYKYLLTEQVEKDNMKFDVIVGNPPYQAPSEGNGNNNKLWPKFIDLAVKLTNVGGFVGFVTPTSGLAPNNKTLTTFQNNHLLFVDFSAKKHFNGVGSQFGSWVLQVGAQGLTKIGTLTVDLKTVAYFPSVVESFSIHKKVTFVANTKLSIEYDPTANVIYTTKDPSRLSRTPSPAYPYKCFHTNAQFLWSARLPKNFADKKVVFTLSGHLKPFFDNGTLGTSDTSRYILVNSEHEGNNLVVLLKSKLYQFILNTAKWGGFVNANVLKLLPLLDLSHTWTDAELYDHFNLTKEEIALIESTIK